MIRSSITTRNGKGYQMHQSSMADSQYGGSGYFCHTVPPYLLLTIRSVVDNFVSVDILGVLMGNTHSLVPSMAHRFVDLPRFPRW